MRVFIIGVDGYLGWALAQYLASRGHVVGGIDNLNRRAWVTKMGACSAIPIAEPKARVLAMKDQFGPCCELASFVDGVGYADEFGRDVTDYAAAERSLLEFAPDTIVHLAQMPSAPWSMRSVEACVETHRNNDVGMLHILWAMKKHMRDVPLVTIGSMGEYGTPDCDIPEGFFEPEWRGKKAKLLFPRQPASYYHATKVHCSTNIEAAVRWWGIRATDVMQGVVYGTRHEHMPGKAVFRTRLDFDECFGTAINRFVCQAVVGDPITLYGDGGQARGFLPLRDSMQCLALAIEQPPAEATYRVLNQFDKVYSITELADIVALVAQMDFGLKPKILTIGNPRVEAARHYYKPDRQILVDLGYEPRADIRAEVREMFEDLLPHRDRIGSHRCTLIPKITWR
jgi:UDP-sulfoquinovose synthase